MDGRSSSAQHHCLVASKARGAAKEPRLLTCHYCRLGFPSYALYLDHLHSSQCGHRQRRNNKAHAAVELPPLVITALNGERNRNATVSSE